MTTAATPMPIPAAAPPERLELDFCCVEEDVDVDAEPPAAPVWVAAVPVAEAAAELGVAVEPPAEVVAVFVCMDNS
jgi:hypothetical protein